MDNFHFVQKFSYYLLRKFLYHSILVINVSIL